MLCGCLDRVSVFGGAHLRQILSAYAAYYNQVRTHLALGKDAPIGPTVQWSAAIVSIPIYDGAGLGGGSGPSVTIVGFLQVFILSVDAVGDMTVTVMNVSGCGNAVPSGTTALNGTSPVPIRLITPQ